MPRALAKTWRRGPDPGGILADSGSCDFPACSIVWNEDNYLPKRLIKYPIERRLFKTNSFLKRYQMLGLDVTHWEDVLSGGRGRGRHMFAVVVVVVVVVMATDTNV